LNQTTRLTRPGGTEPISTRTEQRDGLDGGRKGPPDAAVEASGTILKQKNKNFSTYFQIPMTGRLPLSIYFFSSYPHSFSLLVSTCVFFLASACFFLFWISNAVS
jgi:hypothetical protein